MKLVHLGKYHDFLIFSSTSEFSFCLLVIQDQGFLNKTEGAWLNNWNARVGIINKSVQTRVPFCGLSRIHFNCNICPNESAFLFRANSSGWLEVSQSGTSSRSFLIGLVEVSMPSPRRRLIVVGICIFGQVPIFFGLFNDHRQWVLSIPSSFFPLERTWNPPLTCGLYGPEPESLLTIFFSAPLVKPPRVDCKAPNINRVWDDISPIGWAPPCCTHASAKQNHLHLFCGIRQQTC